MPMPTDFPSAPYERLNVLVGAYDESARPEAGTPTDKWRDYASARNGILYRFLTAADADEAYGQASALPNDVAEKRYAEEKALFAFFTSLVSLVELLCYCSFAIGAMANGAVFPLATEQERRCVNPQRAKNKFVSAYGAEAITRALKNLLSTYKEANELRNVLSHRGAPPRKVFLHLGGHGRDRTEWGPGPFEIDANTTANLRPWMTQHTAACLSALCEFAESHLQPAPRAMP